MQNSEEIRFPHLSLAWRPWPQPCQGLGQREPRRPLALAPRRGGAPREVGATLPASPRLEVPLGDECCSRWPDAAHAGVAPGSRAGRRSMLVVDLALGLLPIGRHR